MEFPAILNRKKTAICIVMNYMSPLIVSGGGFEFNLAERKPHLTLRKPHLKLRNVSLLTNWQVRTTLRR